MKTWLYFAALTVLAAVVLSSSDSHPASASGMAAVSAGGAHTCALTSTGGVKCWGDNYAGALGDGTHTDRRTPVDVVGLDAGMTAIAAGGGHSCALSVTGGVKCWGANHDGQLGDGANVDRSAPVDVAGLASGVVAISAGEAHTCALSAAGGVKCWGWNNHGQLGDGSTTDRNVPVEVLGLGNGMMAVDAGYYHTCAVTAAGGVECWGYNGYGQLGDGTTVERHTPVAVSGLSGGVTEVAVGLDHTCALTVAGGVKCWGHNGDGQLGDGTTTDRYGPGDVSGPASGVAGIATGYNHTCALTAAWGDVKCWGENNSGQVGDGSTTDRHTPVDVSGLLAGATAITAGGEHTCALTHSGRIICWGDNNPGQLGDGTSDARCVPVYTADAVYRDTLAAPLPVPDADPAGVSDSITVGDAGMVEDLNVSVEMSHPWVGDLIVTLTHEDTGTSAVLIDRPGVPSSDVGCGYDDILTVLDDEARLTAEEMCESISPAIGGSAIPLEPLSAFDFESVQGTWTLHVSDNTLFGLGMLDAWGLIVAGKTALAAGDVDCDGNVNAIDAALVLQFGAGLLASLPCQQSADVNQNGTLDAIDAALILQFSAGLVETLPP